MWIFSGYSKTYCNMYSGILMRKRIVTINLTLGWITAFINKKKYAIDFASVHWIRKGRKKWFMPIESGSNLCEDRALHTYIFHFFFIIFVPKCPIFPNLHRCCREKSANFSFFSDLDETRTQVVDQQQKFFG